MKGEGDLKHSPMKLRTLLAALALLGLIGCGQDDLLQKFSSPEDQAAAKAYVDQLRLGKLEEIEKALDPSIRTPNIRDTLKKMADLIPIQEPSSIKLVGAHLSSASGVRTTNTTLEYGFGKQWLLASVAVQDKNGVKTVVGFHINPITQSLEEQNRFNFVGKSVTHYAVLAAAVAAVPVTLYALVACLRTKPLKRKWLWMLFILVGVGKLAVNWTTGGWAFAPVSIQFISVSAHAALYGPWIVAVSIPIGALIFLFYKKPRLEKGETASPS